MVNTSKRLIDNWKSDVLSSFTFTTNEDGGPGSGNFGHAGVKGQIGGSAPSDVSANSFHGSGGDFEVSGNIKDLFLTDNARSNVEKAVKNVRTAKDLEDYLSGKDIKLSTSTGRLANEHWNDEIPSVKEQIDYIVAAVEQFEDVGSLSAIKEIHFYDNDTDGQGGYVYRAKGEGPVEDEGHVYLSRQANGAQVIHEFAHAFADSTKPEGMDAVEWSAKLNSECGLPKGTKGYFGQNSDHAEAEKFAQAISAAIAYGTHNRNGNDNLQFLANVANYVKKNRTDGGPGSGNFGHKGIKGQVGGSAPSESSDNLQKSYKANVTEKTRNEIRSLLDRHTTGHESQHDADYEIAHHIARKDTIGKALLQKSEMEKAAWRERVEKAKSDSEKLYESKISDIEDAMKPGGYLENYSKEQLEDMNLWPQKEEFREPMFYRKGDLGSPTMAFSTRSEGANMSPVTNGEEGSIGYDHAFTMKELEDMGYSPIAGIKEWDVGMSGESEVLFAATNPSKEQLSSLKHSNMTIKDIANADIRKQAMREEQSIKDRYVEQSEKMNEDLYKKLGSLTPDEVKSYTDLHNALKSKMKDSLTELGKKYNITLGDNVVPYDIDKDPRFD